MKPGLEREVEQSTFAIFCMSNSREFKNSKFKPMLLFVKEEGQNILKQFIGFVYNF